MKLTLSRSSFVVVGKWNTAILSPKWVADEIFGVANIEVSVPVMGSGPPKYKADSFELVVAPEKIIFVPLNQDDEVLRKIESAAAKMLKILRYTPISAFGENFHFESEVAEIEDGIEDILNLRDDGKLASKGAIRQKSIKRTLDRPDHFLNLTLDKNDRYHLGFNYHYSITDAE